MDIIQSRKSTFYKKNCKRSVHLGSWQIDGCVWARVMMQQVGETWAFAPTPKTCTRKVSIASVDNFTRYRSPSFLYLKIKHIRSWKASIHYRFPSTFMRDVDIWLHGTGHGQTNSFLYILFGQFEQRRPSQKDWKLFNGMVGIIPQSLSFIDLIALDNLEGRVAF